MSHAQPPHGVCCCMESTLGTSLIQLQKMARQCVPAAITAASRDSAVVSMQYVMLRPDAAPAPLCQDVVISSDGQFALSGQLGRHAAPVGPVHRRDHAPLPGPHQGRAVGRLLGGQPAGARASAAGRGAVPAVQPCSVNIELSLITRAGAAVQLGASAGVRPEMSGHAWQESLVACVLLPH